jgi:hypothetical protein
MRPLARHLARFIAASAAPALALAAPLTFNMDEVTQYSDVTMCTNADLNTVSDSLATTMRADGWSGNRFVNASAWPQDYRDKSLDAGGLDDAYGDANSLTLFAGHGGSGLLTFRPRNGVCTASAGNDMALGNGSTGGLGTIGIWLSCEMLAGGLLDEGDAGYRRMNLRQSMGWTNSIAIGDDEARDFYNSSKTLPNKDAWIRQMQSGGRKPMVLSATTATDAATCWAFHGSQSLGQHVVDTLSGGWGHRCWEWIN